MALLYENVVALQTIINHAYTLDFLYFFAHMAQLAYNLLPLKISSLSDQPFCRGGPERIFRRSYGPRTGTGREITLQKYAHPKFCLFDLKFGMKVGYDVVDNPAECTLLIFSGFRFTALLVLSISRNLVISYRTDCRNAHNISHRYRRTLR